MASEKRTLALSERECEAVMSYIWNHSRCSPNGTAFKVWKRMYEFVNSRPAPVEVSVADAADVDFMQEGFGVDL